MHLKYQLKILLITFSISVLLFFALKWTSSLSENNKSPSKRELEKLKTEINNKQDLLIEGVNLNLNVNDYITTKTINNMLNLEPYEYNYLTYSGYLSAFNKTNIEIKINVNGFKDQINKDIRYIAYMNSDIFDKNINDLIYFNNNYYFSNDNNLYTSNNGVDFDPILTNYDILNIKGFKNYLFLLTSDNKILEYNLKSKSIQTLNLNLTSINILPVRDAIYIVTTVGLYKYNFTKNKLSKINDYTINKICYFNNEVYFSSQQGLFTINQNDESINIYIGNIKTFSLDKIGNIYFIMNNELYYYSLGTAEKININVSTINLEEIFCSKENIIYIISNKEIYYLNGTNLVDIKFFSNDDNIKVLENNYNTYYIYSPSSIKGIIFYQSQ